MGMLAPEIAWGAGESAVRRPLHLPIATRRGGYSRRRHPGSDPWSRWATV